VTLFELDPPSGEGRLRTARGLLKLLAQAGIGQRRAQQLAARFSDWQEMAAASPKELSQVAGKAAAALSQAPEPADEVDLPNGVRLIGAFDDDYPTPLRALTDAPAVLWVRGSLPPRRSIAVVGTRDATEWGLRVSNEVGRAAAAHGVAVVSGLALGVDTATHRGCLDAGGSTFAVLGCGVDVPSPPSNRGLAEEIIAAGGGLIAEVACGSAPSRRTLVARNRLQVALSAVTVVTECGLPSGTLHTARFTIQQGHPLAVLAPPPGRVGPQNAGTTALVDPGGCPPAVLAASGELARSIAARRPVADLVIGAPDDFRRIWDRLP
jgi:DNA processing protein